MRVLLYDPSTRDVERGGDELIERWRSSPGRIAWFDFEIVEEAWRKAILEDLLSLHPLAIEDVLRQRHPPKVEQFGAVLLIMLRELDADTSDIHFGYVGVSVFVGPDFLVTRSTGPSKSVERVWNQLGASPAPLHSTSALALRICDVVARRYLPILLGLEPRLEELEDEIFANPSDVLLAELTTTKSRLKQLRRIFTYHGQVFRELGRLPDLEINARYEHELTDVVDQTDRSASLAELYYELASDLADAYLGLSSHRLNQVMKVLTIFTVIFVPLSFLAGIYGMNFEHMPELHTRFGYYVLLGAMGLVVCFQLFLFRRKRWL